MLYPVRGDSVVQKRKGKKVIFDQRATRQFQGILKNVSLLLFCVLEEWIMVSLAKEQSKLLQPSFP